MTYGEARHEIGQDKAEKIEKSQPPKFCWGILPGCYLRVILIHFRSVFIRFSFVSRTRKSRITSKTAIFAKGIDIRSFDHIKNAHSNKVSSLCGPLRLISIAKTQQNCSAKQLEHCCGKVHAAPSTFVPFQTH